MHDPTTPHGIVDATFTTSRVLPHAPETVFAAFARADVLARWWGPAGFTNTFEIFEFEPGGSWVFVMHGPNGSRYSNESTFREITPPSRVVVEHISPPHFVLTLRLSPVSSGTRLVWEQVFESATVAASVKHIVEPANEQNLDRLESVLGEP